MEQPNFKGDKRDLRMIKKAIEAQDPAIWNNWKVDKKPNLTGIDLHGEILHGFDFQFTNLEDTNFAGCKMTTRFDHAKLNGSNFSGAFLWVSRFDETDVQNAYFSKCDFSKSTILASDFSFTDLTHSKFIDCDLEDSKFNYCEFEGASFQDSFLFQTNFEGSMFSQTNFMNANLKSSNFKYTKIFHSNLKSAILNNVDFTGSTIKYCSVYGIAAWNLEMNNVIQSNLIISDYDEPLIDVADLEVAQFINLIIDNQKIGNVVNTVTTKVVLLLGRFYEERKIILDALRDELQKRNFVPIIFDFKPSPKRDKTETIVLLSSISKFIIADVTDAKSIPQELSHVIPFLPSVPVLPIILKNEKPYDLMEHWKPYPWLFSIFGYIDKNHLIENIETKILKPVDDWKNKKDKKDMSDRKIKELEKKIKVLEKKLQQKTNN